MKITSGQRIGAFLIDYGILMVIGIPICIISIVIQIFSDNFYSQIFLFTILFNFFLCKDLFALGQSKGKSICKLHITKLNNDTPSPLILVLRNLFIVIWPIELLIIIINPERRLADIIFGTKVSSYKAEITPPTTNHIKSFIKYYPITLIFCCIIMLLILLLIKDFNQDTFKLLKLLYS